MGLFLSTFVNKIDSKGRISVPANFRASLAQESFQGVVLFRSYKHEAIEGCGYKRIENMSQAIDTQTDIFSDIQDNLTASIFADCVQLPFDGEGRIVLPVDFMAFANLKDKAAFVGRGQTFQIWSPESFTTVQTQARSRLQGDQQLSLRMQPDVIPKLTVL